eukprot:543306-Hanusia_phi.AAC.1
MKRRRAFITIDRAVLWGILTDAGLNRLGYSPSQYQQIPFHYAFTYTASPAVPVSTETARIIAIDPGRVTGPPSC